MWGICNVRQDQAGFCKEGSARRAGGLPMRTRGRTGASIPSANNAREISDLLVLLSLVLFVVLLCLVGVCPVSGLTLFDE